MQENFLEILKILETYIKYGFLSPLRHSFVPYEIVVMMVQHKLNYLYNFVPKKFENEKLWKIEILIFLLKTTKPQFWLKILKIKL